MSSVIFDKPISLIQISEMEGIKVVVKSAGVGGISQLKRELRILPKLNHPNIVSVIKSTTDSLVLEYADKGDLINFYTFHVQFDTMKNILLSIASALDYLHSMRIAHCDIKPDNVLFFTDSKDSSKVAVKICDFGAACILGKWDQSKETEPITERKGLLGTVMYMAPEQLEKKISTKTDVWGLGTIMYCLFTASSPPRDTKPGTIPKVIRTLSHVPKYAIDLMYKCYDKDPNKRPSMKEIIDCLNN